MMTRPATLADARKAADAHAYAIALIVRVLKAPRRNREYVLSADRLRGIYYDLRHLEAWTSRLVRTATDPACLTALHTIQIVRALAEKVADEYQGEFAAASRTPLFPDPPSFPAPRGSPTRSRSSGAVHQGWVGAAERRAAHIDDALTREDRKDFLPECGKDGERAEYGDVRSRARNRGGSLPDVQRELESKRPAEHSVALEPACGEGVRQWD